MVSSGFNSATLKPIPIGELQIRKTLSTNTATFTLYESRVIMVKYLERREEFSVRNAIDHTCALANLSEDSPSALVLDFRDRSVSFSNEARNYFAKNPSHARLRSCQAILVDNLAQRIVANFYVKFNKPNCPVRIFEKPAKAMDWAMSVVHANISLH